MTATAPRRVVILGGGMAGLTAAWSLSGPDSPTPCDVTVYQRGWRLGGKGASSRGVNGRIEEHGLHVLLGHYHQTFDLMESVYAELDRPRTDPDSPLATWSEAVKPSGAVSLAEKGDSTTGDPDWSTWSMSFSVDDSRPGGKALATAGRGLMGMSLSDLVMKSLRLVLDFFATAEPDTGDEPAGLVLSGSPQHPGMHGAPRAASLLDPALLARAASVTALAGVLELVGKVGDAGSSRMPEPEVASAIQEQLQGIERALTDALGTAGVADAQQLDRFRVLLDLVFTNLRGIVADAVLTGPGGLSRIDHLDYGEWLRSHGAREATIDSGIVRGMYDLVFAYDRGAADRPAFAAGLGLDLAVRMLLDHHGGIFWKMQAGMGEVIFAPLYQALRDRGVRFAFFHDLQALSLDPTGTAIDSIDLTCQAHTAAGGEYAPLIDAGGLAAWPAEPLYDQLDPDMVGCLGMTETIWHEGPGVPLRLEAGRDFDQVVLAVSLGMVPLVAADLLAASDRWRQMVEQVQTVPTQAFQLWLRTTDAERGWSGPDNTTLSGFRQPFDTWASMGHLLPFEQWSDPAHAPGGIAYFCSALAEPDLAEPARLDPAVTLANVAEDVAEFMDGDLGVLWPNAVGPHGFDRDQLVANGSYVRANIDPSDRYVQSVPGSDRYRMAPGDTGLANLVVAGDWTDCGLNAGCIEAAVRSGHLAATAIFDAQPEPEAAAGVGANA